METNVAIQRALTGKTEVLEAMAGHAAVRAILDWKPEALENAKFVYDELTLTIAPAEIRAAAQTIQAAGYNFLEDVTAVDWLPASPRFQVSYHLLSHQRKERIRLIALLDGETPHIDSIVPVWPSANFYEREIFDLFGIEFEGHPNLRRIMMPDDWTGHPLRKDYPVEGYR